MPVKKRVQVYEEEGCGPREVPEEHRPPDAGAAHDVWLPDPASPQMSRLADRLELVRDDPPPEGLSEWEKILW